jgi:hypothetical protein
MVLVGIGVVIAALLLFAFLIDRRDRRHGHRSRSAGEMSAMVREADRDAPTIDSAPSMTLDVSWTDVARRNRQG